MMPRRRESGGRRRRVHIREVGDGTVPGRTYVFGAPCRFESLDDLTACADPYFRTLPKLRRGRPAREA